MLFRSGGLEVLLDRVPAQDPSQKLKSSKHYNRQKQNLYDHRETFRGSRQGNAGSFTLPGVEEVFDGFLKRGAAPTWPRHLVDDHEEEPRSGHEETQRVEDLMELHQTRHRLHEAESGGVVRGRGEVRGGYRDQVLPEHDHQPPHDHRP